MSDFWGLEFLNVQDGVPNFPQKPLRTPFSGLIRSAKAHLLDLPKCPFFFSSSCSSCSGPFVLQALRMCQE